MQTCAVIGCGPAGMAASTLLRQCGLMVTCFELAAAPGGVWCLPARDVFSTRGVLSPIYPTMRCVLPKDFMSFSDVRFDYTVPQFPHHSSVRHYLQQYAEAKSVYGMTRFNTKVESVRLDPKDSQWKLITVNITNGDAMAWSFDKVCVCTGQTQEVRFPIGLRELLQSYIQEGGELHHTAHVKDFRIWKNKRVVVVGDGVSAYDYCAELKRFGADVYHSTTMTDDSCDASSLPWHSGAWKKTEGEEGGGGSGRRRLWRLLEPLFRSLEPSGGAQGGHATIDLWPLLTQAARRIPGSAAKGHRDSQMVRRWLRYRNEHNARIPRLGYPVGTDGRGILFSSDPLHRTSASELVEEAQQRSSAGACQMPDTKGGEGEGTFLDHVDAVICATGYHVRYPFLHSSIRREVEDPALMIAAERGQTSPPAAHTGAKRPRFDNGSCRRGLFLGTLYASQPSLAFVGSQRDLLPPFLMYEAQARFIAYSFTQCVPLPASTEELERVEMEMLRLSPGLAGLYAPDGLGLHSAAYFNALTRALGVSSHDTFASQLMARQRWVVVSSLLRIVHWLRSLAPLKRKQQHLLFDNRI